MEIYTRRARATYGVRMRDEIEPRNEWGAFVHHLTKRPGWSIARLSRAAGIHRSTIFRWINGDFKNARLPNIKIFAEAAEVDYHSALQAATGIQRQIDEEDQGAIRIILESDASDTVKRELVEHVRTRRLEHEAQRRREIELILRSVKTAETAEG